MVLVSEDDDGLSFFFSFEESSSEESLSEDEESLESLELESDGGNGVFTAATRDFLSAFFAGLFSESDDEEPEDESLSEESLSEESESDEEEPEDSEDESLDLDSVENLAFLFLGASFSDSESESESESESDSELDSAFRFKPVDLEAGATSSSSSSSSSASLSELEEEDEDEDEEDEDEGDDSRDAFLAFGASSISTSESLESSELLSLSLSLSLEEELGLADFFTFDWRSQFWNSSSNDGAFFESAGVMDLSACSLAKALFVFSKPCSDKKLAIDATSCAGGDDALELLLALVWWCKQLSATSASIGVLIVRYLLGVLRLLCRGSLLSSHGECPYPGVSLSFLFTTVVNEETSKKDTKKKKSRKALVKAVCISRLFIGQL